MKKTILQAGQLFPNVEVPNLAGGSINIGKPEGNFDWKMVVVYRGKHCPICTNLLIEINQNLVELNSLNIDVVAVSADSIDSAREQMNDVKPSFPIGYNLSIEQMKNLGLFISEPRLGMNVKEPFAEPALFVINEKGNVQIIDISNVPFTRPNIDLLMMGLKFIRNITEQYPVNGTFSN